MPSALASRSVAAILLDAYARNGCLRRQDERRLRREGHDSYKKGDEVRLIATSRRELSRLRRALAEAGFQAGKPFEKGTRWCQPIYGREQVRRFLRLIRIRPRTARAG